MCEHGREHESDKEREGEKGKHVSRREHLDKTRVNQIDSDKKNLSAARDARETAERLNREDPNQQPGLAGNGIYNIIPQMAQSGESLRNTPAGNLEGFRNTAAAVHIYEGIHEVLGGVENLGLDSRTVAAEDFPKVEKIMNNENLDDEEKRRAIKDRGYARGYDKIPAPINPGSADSVVANIMGGGEGEGNNQNRQNQDPGNDNDEVRQNVGGAEKSCWKVISDNPKYAGGAAALVTVLLAAIALIAAGSAGAFSKKDEEGGGDDNDVIDPAWRILLETADNKEQLKKELQGCLTKLKNKTEANYWNDLINEVRDGTMECLPKDLGAKKPTRMPYEIQLMVINFMALLQEPIVKNQKYVEVDGEKRADAARRVRNAVKPNPFPVKKPADGTSPDPVPLWEAIRDLKTQNSADMSRLNKLIILRNIVNDYLGGANDNN